MSLTALEEEARAAIFAAFAATGAPPEPPPVREALEALAARHVVALDAGGAIHMAHPFAAHHGGARVQAGGRVWWGSCAWDGLGICAALGLTEATLTDASGLVVELAGGRPAGRAVFHVAVPAREWWADIGFT